MQPWQQAQLAAQQAQQAAQLAAQQAQQAAQLAAQQPTNQAAQLAAMQAQQAAQLAAMQAQKANQAVQQAQQAYSQRCRTCGIQNRFDAHFCNSCGAPLYQSGKVSSRRRSRFGRVLLTLYGLAVLALILSVLYVIFLSNLFTQH
jgi:hypothetical protein